MQRVALVRSCALDPNIPGTDAWVSVVDWLNDLLAPIADQYDVAFIDCNPSFSIYTQIALSAVDRLVLPVMADDSSRRAIQNAFSLVYGLKLPSDIYATYAFATRLRSAGQGVAAGSHDREEPPDSVHGPGIGVFRRAPVD